LKQEDREFLEDLNEHTNRTVEYTMTPNMSGSPYKAKGIDYIDKFKITDKQMERTLEIVKTNPDVILRPIQGPFGFHPAFTVTLLTQEHPDVPVEVNNLLCFDQNQYKGEDSFDTLLPHFMEEENQRLMKFYGLEKIMYRSWYFY
jgi:hypothetical protein